MRDTSAERGEARGRWKGNLVWCLGKLEQGKMEPDKEPRNFGSIINTVYCEDFFLISNRALQKIHLDFFVLE